MLKFAVAALTGLSLLPSLSKAQTDESLIQAVASEIQGLVREDSSRHSVFHFTRSNDPAPIVDDKARNYIASRVEAFWKTSGSTSADQESIYGDGLYTALEPFSTQRYGKPNFALYLFELNSPRKTIDLGDENLSESTLAEMKKLGCDESPMAFEPGLSSMLSNASQRCRKIAVEAIARTGAQAISYEYPSYPLEGCKPIATNLKRAIVILDATIINAFKVFGPESSSTDEDVIAIETLARNNVLPKVLRQGTPLWPKVNASSNEIALSWAKKHLFNCQ